MQYQSIMLTFNYNNSDFQQTSYEPLDISIPKYPGLSLPEELYEEPLPEIRRYSTTTTIPFSYPEFPETFKPDIDEFEDYSTQNTTDIPITIPATKLDKVKYLMNRLQKDLGLTKNQAAGVAGNIEVESGFRENIRGDKGAAYGIAQWHPERRKNVDLSTYEKQVDHLIHEIKTERTWLSRNGLNKLKSAKTAKEAAEIFDRDFERSSGQHLKRRQNWAEKYSRYKKGGKI